MGLASVDGEHIHLGLGMMGLLGGHLVGAVTVAGPRSMGC